MVLEGCLYLIITNVDRGSSVSARVTKRGEAVDGRDDDAGKVSASSEAVSNTTDECKWREDDGEAEE